MILRTLYNALSNSTHYNKSGVYVCKMLTRRKLYCVPVTRDMATTDYEDMGESVYLHSYHLHSFTALSQSTILC